LKFQNRKEKNKRKRSQNALKALQKKNSKAGKKVTFDL